MGDDFRVGDVIVFKDSAPWTIQGRRRAEGVLAQTDELMYGRVEMVRGVSERGPLLLRALLRTGRIVFLFVCFRAQIRARAGDVAWLTSRFN